MASAAQARPARLTAVTEPRFPPELVERLRHELEVKLETRAEQGAPTHRTIVWVVVDDRGRVLARSYRGATARWYREATSGSAVALIVGDDRAPVSVRSAADLADACSAALVAKYAGDPATPAMVRPEVLETTLELRPA